MADPPAQPGAAKSSTFTEVVHQRGSQSWAATPHKRELRDGRIGKSKPYKVGLQISHIFVATLAFVIHRALEKKLRAAGLDLSATEALTALKCVRVVDFRLGDGAIKRAVTRPTPRATSVLRVVGVTTLDPPAPPRPSETICRDNSRLCSRKNKGLDAKKLNIG